MNGCGQHFSQAMLGRIQETVRREPSLSRLELSRRVCDWLNWRSPSGRLQDMGCRKALAQLERRGLLELPRQGRRYGFERGGGNAVALDLPELCCPLRDLGEVTVTPVSSRYAKASKVWFALLDRYHYLGSGPLCGAQLRYVVRSATHGYLGALALSSAAWALKARDAYIGWTEGARRANLDRVVANDRFLLLPTVQVKHLASKVLALALARLPEDWAERYGVRPVLVETFVDPSRFAGTCYQAANWTYVGDTAGRRDGRAKQIFLYPLERRWRKVLSKHCGAAPAIPVWAVYVTEKANPGVKEPLERMLLTTVAVTSFAEAQRRVEWYTGRWGIEVYHRTLKSGCRIEDRQLETAERLEACLGVDMVVAWRIYYLTMLGREPPELPCTVFFKEIEWQALCCYVNKTPLPPRDATRYQQDGLEDRSPRRPSGKKGRWLPRHPDPLARAAEGVYCH
jgi:hypothetical protein